MANNQPVHLSLSQASGLSLPPITYTCRSPVMDFDPDHPERNGNGGVFTAEHRPCHCEGCDLCEKRTFKIVGNLIRNVECRFACEDCHEDDPANDPASNGDFCRYCTYCVEILTPTRERRIGLQCEFECQDCSDSEECWYLERVSRGASTMLASEHARLTSSRDTRRRTRPSTSKRSFKSFTTSSERTPRKAKSRHTRVAHHIGNWLRS